VIKVGKGEAGIIAGDQQDPEIFDTNPGMG